VENPPFRAFILALNGKGKNKVMDLLKKGDYVGIVAPGSPAPRQVIERGINVLESLGFKIKLGKHIFDITEHNAGLPENRASDINNFFSDWEVKAIITARGGYNCNQVLPYLDYSLIKKNPKIFLGLSDVTAILNAITSRTGIVTFHGPVLLMIGGGRDGLAFSQYSQEHFKKILMGKMRKNIHLMNAFTNWRVLKKGQIAGRLFGGNLVSLTSIIGTLYEPNWEDKILIWETVGERIEMINQMLTHLKLAGVFDKINGMIVGRVIDTQPKEEINMEKRIIEMILDQCKPYSFPVIYGVDFGHINDNLILPIGGEVRFDTKDNIIKIIKY